MKSTKSNRVFRSLAELKVLLENGSLPPIPQPVRRPPKPRDCGCDPAKETALFKAAMTGVKKIVWKNTTAATTGPRPLSAAGSSSESECLRQLSALVETGAGFVVAHTPEYIQGTGYKVSPEIARRLHRGDFAIRDHIDLHGLNVEDAHRAFDHFLEKNIAAGHQAVLIIHGRGLSSPGEPILKTRVRQWLTCGAWRKWTMAYCSARWCDGGAGATYVLLRRVPLKKRRPKKRVAL